MDLLQLAGMVGVSVAVGFIGAAQKYAKQIRAIQHTAFSTNVESITRMHAAAMGTMVEDYKLNEDEARAKFFTRCAAAGMKLVRIDQQTGKHEVVAAPSNEDHKSS
ncbi:MAG TPA: hypothetical protein VN734_17325 [Acidobacteriaceae bacterium]|nr:hypothetical protein [Acidobacteriaceae bacterium]